MEKDVDPVQQILLLFVGLVARVFKLESEPHAVPLGGVGLEGWIVGVAFPALPGEGTRFHPLGLVGQQAKS